MTVDERAGRLGDERGARDQGHGGEPLVLSSERIKQTDAVSHARRRPATELRPREARAETARAPRPRPRPQLALLLALSPPPCTGTGPPAPLVAP